MCKARDEDDLSDEEASLEAAEKADPFYELETSIDWGKVEYAAQAYGDGEYEVRRGFDDAGEPFLDVFIDGHYFSDLEEFIDYPG